MPAAPVIPYVGFKGWQAQAIRGFADRIGQPFELFDPFFGGGGSLQALARHRRLARVEVSDIVPALCELWMWLLRDPDTFRGDVEGLLADFPLTTANFKKVRTEAVTDPVALLYVLLWGFNGLFRTNAKGECNVPMGKGSRQNNPQAALARVFDRSADIVAGLKKSDIYAYIEVASFDQAMARAMEPRRCRLPVLCYLDPPYVGGFAGYAGKWAQDDLDHLIACTTQMGRVRPGIYVLCGTPDNLSHLADEGWEVLYFDRKSRVSCDVSTRGTFKEAVALLDTMPRPT